MDCKEKMLHERLRDLVDKTSFNDPRKVLNIDFEDKCEKRNCVWCSIQALEAFADEIERCYIPRPRYEDGEPVQFGDEVELHYKAGGCEKGRIQAFHVNRGPVWMLSFVGCDHEVLYRYDSEADVLKRPAPKVLDADGVSICKGDTVWDVDSGEKLTVQEFANRGCGLVQCCNEDGGCEYHDAHSLAHEKPVFDADGERIKVGDMVWRVEDGLKMKVRAVGEEALEKHGCSVATLLPDDRWDCYGVLHYSGKEVTHREPDSMEKLRADIYMYAACEGGDVEVSVEQFADRLSALMER